LLFDCYDITILAVVLPMLVPLWKITPVQIGMLASGGFMGMLAGALLFGVLADIIGRWKVFQITLLIYALLTGACALAGGFASLFMLRIAVGLGLGGLVPVDLAYLVEYIPSKYRGRFLGWFNAFSPLGNASAMFVGALLVSLAASWRWGFILGIIPAFFLIIVRRGLPESVRYLVHKDRIPEAVQIVEGFEQRVLEKVTVPRKEAVEREKLMRSMSTEAKVRIPDLFKGGLARSTITVCTLWFCVNYVLYGLAPWLPILLMKELHYAMAKGFIFLAVANLIGMTGQFSAGLNMDYLGRRPTVVYSVILLGLVPYFLFWLGTTPSLGIVFLIVLYIFNSSSFASIYAYTPEVFPTRVRATGTGFASAIGRGGAMLGPTILGIVYAKAGLIWALSINMAVLVCAAIVVLAVGRETKGKTLEQISVEQMELRQVREEEATI
ncbi:MAG TPA: MFS transporter, partial [Syntrophorhabdales bacterium]|nr:MFS transporter [Syntrophorhabdales bacterium]